MSLFMRSLDRNGQYLVACGQCGASVGKAFWEAQVDTLESQHSCGLRTAERLLCEEVKLIVEAESNDDVAGPPMFSIPKFRGRCLSHLGASNNLSKGVTLGQN